MDHNEILVAIVDLKASIGVISGEAGREMMNESTYEMCVGLGEVRVLFQQHLPEKVF